MADVNKIKDHLTCPVCMKLFVKPKYLSCYHSFCKECLEMMQPHSKIKCPVCRRETTVPAGGVKELDNNFFISYLVDELILQDKVSGEVHVRCELCPEEDPVVTFCENCVQFLCNVCSRHHQRANASRDHNTIPLTELRTKKDKNFAPKPETIKCSKHDEEMLFYCEMCDQLVCMHCTVTNHRDHRCCMISDIAKKHRNKLQEVCAPLKDMISNLSKTYDTIDKMRETIKQEGDEVNKKIDEYYHGLIKKLEEQKEQLKQQVCESVSKKVKVVKMQLEEVEHAQAEAVSTKQLHDTLNSCSDQKLLSAKKQVIDCIQRITSKYRNLSTQIIQQATIKFVPSTKLFPQFGWLCSTAVPVSDNCEMVDLPMHVFSKHITNITIDVKDDNGHYCYREGHYSECKVG